jgi:DNA-binding NarL/FixJ family response regulator
VRTPPKPLTKREVEVIHLLVEGLSNEEIAQRLHVSRGTAKAHVANADHKLGAHSRTHLAVMALRRSIVPLHPPNGADRKA